MKDFALTAVRVVSQSLAIIDLYFCKSFIACGGRSFGN
jgi:hypothetical protein